MNTHKLINEQSIAEAIEPSPKLRKRQRAFHVLLAMTAIVVLSGCADGGYYGSTYGYPGSYRSGGYYGGVHRGYSYGTQHSIGRIGFSRGGGGFSHGHGGGGFGHGGGGRGH